MEYKIMSAMKHNANDMRYLINDIKDKIYKLYVNVYLDTNDIRNLVFAIINKDTGIDLDEYNIVTYVDGLMLKIDIDNDEDLTDQEKKYIKKTLEKKYSKEIYKDAIGPVVRQKLVTEIDDIYCTDNEMELVMEIAIPFNEFNIKNEICKYLFEM